ncbi:MAG: antibiotic biosynthesis monooxygenase [Proteobacteria bacterium]|nr:antibiotic biosynthesis monooxygenase [Pseudomonadota bacterium]
MNSRILEHAMLEVRPGQEHAFEVAFAKAQNIISATLEAHTVGFRSSAEYQQWKALLHHFYDPFPTVLHFRTVYTSAQDPVDSLDD